MIEIQFTEAAAREVSEGKRYGTIRTRDGFPVRLLAYDIKGTYPVAGVVDLGEGEHCRQWTKEGKGDFRSYVRTNYDLVIEVEGGEQ